MRTAGGASLWHQPEAIFKGAEDLLSKPGAAPSEILRCAQDDKAPARPLRGNSRRHAVAALIHPHPRPLPIMGEGGEEGGPRVLLAAGGFQIRDDRRDVGFADELVEGGHVLVDKLA
jgi:hypothetical protein